MKNVIFNFIWDKRDRTKRNTIADKQEIGGKGKEVIGLKLKALKASWGKRLVDKSSINSKIISV